MANAAPGWYHAEGDPEGTVRYWDGEQWIGGPVAGAPAAAARPPVTRSGGIARLFNPTGRINRTTFALIWVAAFVLVFGVTVLDLAAGTYDEEAGIGTFGALTVLAMAWPAIATWVKRLHDVGRSAWFLLILLIPFAGFFMLLWLLFWPGQGDANRHGEAPGPGFAL